MRKTRWLAYFGLMMICCKPLAGCSAEDATSAAIGTLVTAGINWLLALGGVS